VYVDRLDREMRKNNLMMLERTPEEVYAAIATQRLLM
jgi:hypothetical protein